ncbi:ribosome biogenesis GTPase Der [Geoalkalibacter halelectricus]|uniref:GTPase Der n=1 Tax=Geoalkalibacter halelectricus TaxID=2847045 RepID=A0ABY5ZR99_9BACT|nr:ribosome biogenesis GTPase Der [Geoalkalibacter halelectricus]MDO3380053.1 ribosome biogenesis GTPase Der [Geoalkalibacter halelectricus]UWZ80425.1 ribosome biogenesis GTPase Der [Geoalkalibacter halelectricus]
MPVVAIVGRPNVGKSTLFNRILGRRKALVEDFPGVTRDRNYAEVTRFDKPFTLIDTGGFEPQSQERLLQQMREQSQLAIEEADLIVFLLDVQQGLTPADQDVANMLRRVDKPVLYVVNKVDGDRQEQGAAEFYALGVEDIFTVSAEHGLGVNHLVAGILARLPEAPKPVTDEEVTRIAVIGRPNVGKSSLVNRLLGYERVVANPVAGTTRDSVDTAFVYNRKPYLLIDTAGIRRKGKVSQKLEKFSVVQALKAMERTDIVLMVIDAEEGVTEQDLNVAGYAHEQGRALLLVVNKWDAIEKDNQTLGRFVEKIRVTFKFLPYAPILFVSALTGQRVAKIMGEVEKVALEYNRQVGTGELNKVVEKAVSSHPPAVYHGKRLKIFYAVQVGVRPPSFVIFVSKAEGFHFSYERYLVNKIRDAFGFQGTPIRLFFRDRERK